jgi:uncharacterized cupin superfamily protein
VNASKILSGEAAESGFTYLTSASDQVVIGVWACGAFRERIDSYPFNEMCTVIEGIVELTDDTGRSETYRTGDTFYIVKGFAGFWQTHSRFRKYFMVSNQ